MTVFAVTAARGSPGATTLTVALGSAFSRLTGGALIIEADPTGGAIGLRFDLAPEPSWATLSADMRRSLDQRLILGNAVDLHGTRCLLAPVDPTVMASVLGRSAGPVAAQLPDLSMPTVIDLGRLDRRSPALELATCADGVLVVCRPRLDEIQSAMFTIRLLNGAGCRPSLVTIGDQPHHPDEVAQLAGVPLAAVVPDDPAMAVAFCGGRHSSLRLRRSTFWRSILALAEQTLEGQTEAHKGVPGRVAGVLTERLQVVSEPAPETWEPSHQIAVGSGGGQPPGDLQARQRPAAFAAMADAWENWSAEPPTVGWEPPEPSDLVLAPSGNGHYPNGQLNGHRPNDRAGEEIYWPTVNGHGAGGPQR